MLGKCLIFQIGAEKIKHTSCEKLLTTALKQKDCGQIYANCINVLENYTLRAYPKVQELKDILQADSRVELALMSGSGPTVFAMCRTIADAKVVCENLRQEGYEAYWTKTIK